MNVYRHPPPVLPSLRPLTAPWTPGGSEAWSEDVTELMAHERARRAPAPIAPDREPVWDSHEPFA